METKFSPYNLEEEAQIRQIRCALHLRTNGEVSKNMARKGLVCKRNYGALLRELKELVSTLCTPPVWLILGKIAQKIEK